MGTSVCHQAHKTGRGQALLLGEKRPGRDGVLQGTQPARIFASRMQYSARSVRGGPSLFLAAGISWGCPVLLGLVSLGLGSTLGLNASALRRSFGSRRRAA